MTTGTLTDQQFKQLSFFILTPTIVAIYAAFLRFQTAPFDQGSLTHSLLFALAFTLPGWWLACLCGYGLAQLGKDHIPAVVIAVLAYGAALIIGRPYYLAVYELISVAQPWTADIVAERYYDLTIAGLESFARINAPGLVIWVACTTLFHRFLDFDPFGHRAAATPQRDAPIAPSALQRAADALKVPTLVGLIRIEAEEHYLRIVTDQTSYLVRHRMRDAVAVLPPELGTQIHRSHWVATDAIVAASRAGKSLTIRTGDGAVIPVSLGYREAVRKLRPDVVNAALRQGTVIADC